MMDSIIKLLKTLNLNKKIRFLFASIIFTSILYIFNALKLEETVLLRVVVAIAGFGFTSIVYSQYYAKAHRMVVYSFVLPLHLLIGYILSFFYFPNLGPLVQLLAYISFGTITYALLLINNIFIVIKERGALIPLYTAAVTWVQILITIISIPYISGVYKIPVDFLVQNILVFASMFAFCFYMIWVVKLDSDTRELSIKERGILSISLSFIVFVFGVGVSFFPSESFLKALFVSTVGMFSLAYIQALYKNRLNKRMLNEYGIISFIFFIILILFNP